MKFHAISETGQRDHNEDDYIAEKVDGFYVFGIADGIGGHAGGEIASRIAVEELKESVKRNQEKGLVEGFEKANKTIYNENIRANSKMATTLIGGIVDVENSKAIIGNVGDSRAYVFNDEIWKTRDHSVVQNLIEKGMITEEEALSHPKKNLITRSIGLEKNVDVDFNLKHLENSILLLCSDGLSGFVNDQEIEEIIKKNEAKVACNKLLKKALEKGSNDNITIIVISFKEEYALS